MDQEVIQNMRCYYWKVFLRTLMNHERKVNALHYQRCSFQRCPCIEFSVGLTVCQARMKLWQAIMIAEVALSEGDFTGFNIHNKDSS
jgi:hypothetical protein